MSCTSEETSDGASFDDEESPANIGLAPPDQVVSNFTGSLQDKPDASVSEHDDVLEYARNQLNEMSPSLQRILRTAACLGSRIVDLSLLSKACDESREQIEEAITQDCPLLSAASDDSDSFVFAESIYLEAIYTSIPEEERAQQHYKIGRRLWKNLGMDQL
jgi:predicted ATPase